MIKINLLLSIYQFFGFIISLILIVIWGNEEGRMAIFFIILAFSLFAPYIITSSLSFFNKKKYSIIISFWMYLSMGGAILMTLAYPLFFDKEFIYLIFVDLSIFILLILLRKDLEKQLLLINVVGSLILTTLVISWVLNLIE